MLTKIWSKILCFIGEHDYEYFALTNEQLKTFENFKRHMHWNSEKFLFFLWYQHNRTCINCKKTEMADGQGYIPPWCFYKNQE